MGRVSDSKFKEMLAEGYSNQEISDMCGYKSKSAVSKRMRSLGIYKKSVLKVQYERAERLQFVKDELQKRGHTVEAGELYSCNFLIDGKFKVDVIGSTSTSKERVLFTLTGGKGSQKEESRRIRILPNGRVRKRFEKLCDFVIFVGGVKDDFTVWVVPPKDLAFDLQTLALNASSQTSKYVGYLENWGALKEPGHIGKKEIV